MTRDGAGNGEGALPVTRSALPEWLQQGGAGLIQAAVERRLHHATLLTGVSGVGKHLLVRALLSALLCENPRPDEGACGACGACRLLKAGTHPDCRWLTPETGQPIRVDDVREMTRHLQLSSRQTSRDGAAGLRVAVLSPADALNAASGNALLKILEEPPGRARLILATARPRRLLPTVRSRCAATAVKAPEPDVACRWLQTQRPDETDPARVERALAACGGAPLAARDWLDSDGPDRLEGAFDDLLTLGGGGDPVRVAQQRQSDPARFVEAMQRVLAECIRRAHGHPPRLRAADSERDAGLDRMAERLGDRDGLQALHRLMEQLSIHRQGLEQPLNPRLAVEAVCLDCRRALGPTRPARRAPV